MGECIRGPMCSEWCGPDWIDDGTMCLSKSLPFCPAGINEPPQKDDPLKDWTSRLMRDYKQHLPMNCGGIAAVFAVFGMNKRVPDSIANTVLIKENAVAMYIAEHVNKLGGTGLKATVFLKGSTIPTSVSNKTPIDFLENLSEIEIVKEGIRDILIVNNARCAIISCDTKIGGHWQVFYLPYQTNRLAIYNEADNWHPVISDVLLGTPSGLVLVSGPRLKE